MGGLRCRNEMKTGPGAPYPLGATWDGAGVNFALFSENATGLELCLFDGAIISPPLFGSEARLPQSGSWTLR